MVFPDPIRPDRDLDGWQVVLNGRIIQLRDMTRDELLCALADQMEIIEQMEESFERGRNLVEAYRHGKRVKPDDAA